MYKFSAIAASVALLAVSAFSFANTSAPKEATVYTSVRNLPVIVSNEMIGADTCRLSFENGLTKDVPCLSSTGAENIAFAPLPEIPGESEIH